MQHVDPRSPFFIIEFLAERELAISHRQELRAVGKPEHSARRFQKSASQRIRFNFLLSRRPGGQLPRLARQAEIGRRGFKPPCAWSRWSEADPPNVIAVPESSNLEFLLGRFVKYSSKRKFYYRATGVRILASRLGAQLKFDGAKYWHGCRRSIYAAVARQHFGN